MSIYDYCVKDRNGNNVSMEQYKGNVLLYDLTIEMDTYKIEER